ncbi:MAG: alpha/beta hydrolase [Lachnospiraceae bacterium]|nr:alpha/beta hydrolase [Lachnospiraceae bacterium]
MSKKYPLHKDLKSLTKMVPPIYKPLLPVMNAAMKIMFQCRSDKMVIVNKYEIDGYEGGKIPVYVIEPRMTDKKMLPCIVFYHGGGFILRASGAHFKLAKEYALRVPCKVVYADYRLAPKHQFPIPVEDCYAAYRWTLEHARKLAIDAGQIVIGGDSAGGNLAIAVTLMAKERNLALPKAEMLIYPVTDRRMITESMKQYTDTPMWNAKLSTKMWRYYLGNNTPECMEYASPLEAKSLESFPPSYVEVAQYDCLRDEGIAFCDRLKKDNVPVECHEVKQACHGFETATESVLTREAMNRRIDFLKNMFSGTCTQT